ncbi:copper chaperone PCu(A)C [Methylophaga nitratireducenticrescens]|uniref:copper chaperone PCu(A)C n=1 Tax=Methylophaga nitratireducenticrescens TaxID=754476 RepID=UPI000CDC6B51|nr:copper chaperone PCu(A)C [Methylophaga nitratireducenticrescens]AUZ85823.1 hypothetical protein CDW43_15180 [Methylophaga nitratireducenticrescens]
MTKFKYYLFFMLSLCFSTSIYADITTENFRIIKAPEVAKSTAGYGVIKNTGDEDDTLIAIHSDKAMVMLHKTEVNADTGMAKMVHLSKTVIEAHSELVLEPMSYHLMLSNFADGFFNDNEIIIVWFEFEKAGKMQVEIPLKASWETMDSQSDDHSHHQHH